MALGLVREGLVVLFAHITWVGVGWEKRSGGLRNPRMPEVASRVIQQHHGSGAGVHAPASAVLP